ncbi:hypothetical protein D082_28510 [Synechocystis sp. PCC 6714]|nr:hypothetical protein D082_28510 [Synechocystis sp. PCC 6714]
MVKITLNFFSIILTKKGTKIILNKLTVLPYFSRFNFQSQKQIPHQLGQGTSLIT